MKQLQNIITPPNFSTDNFPQLGRTLHYITIIIVIGLIYPSLAQIYFLFNGTTDHRINISVILWIQILIALGCFILNKRGYSIAVSRFLPFSFIPFQFALVSSSQFNVYDVAMWTYGPVFILASSLLERRWYIVFSIIQLISITYHYNNELTIQIIPGYSSAQIWNDYFDSISINFVTAIGAYVLSENVRRSYRKATEYAQEVIMAKEHLDLIVQTSPGGIAIFNMKGEITFANKVAKEIFELPDEFPDTHGPLPSWKLTTLSGKEVPFEDYPHIAVQRSGKQTYGHRLQLVFGNGRKKILGISTAPWFNEQHQIVGSLSTFRNITEQLRTEEELAMRKEQISSITENLHSVIYRVQLERGKMIKPLFISDGAKQLFGFTAEELMTDIRKFMSSIYRTDAVNDIKRLRELVDDPKPFEYEYRVVTKSGEVRWQRNSGSPYTAADGSVIVDGFVLDITAQKAVEQQLQMLGQAVSNSSEVIFMTDTKERFIFINPRFTELYGYTADEIIGIHTPKILENIPSDIVLTHSLWEQLNQMKIVTTVFNNISKHGITIEVESSISPIVDRHGNLQGYLSIQRDITERKKIEEAIQQSKKMESLSILAGGVAHEFNNLLTTILGRATMYQNKTEFGSPVHSAFIKIEQSALRASELTKQLLAYSGRSKFEIRSVNMNEIILENLGFLSKTSSQPVHYTTELSDDLLPVRADIRQMKQLIINLTANAVEAVTGRTAKITIRTAVQSPSPATLNEWSVIPKTSLPSGEYVVIEVEDNGTGMNPDVLEKMFDPFFTTKFTGRGLGLSAVLGIVQGHRGGITVRSTPNTGTVIVIALPAYRSSDIPKPKSIVSDIKKSVLSIDDEEMNLELVKDIFESEGIAVHSSTNTAKAITILKEHLPEIALILLDVNIPGSSCLETVHRLRETAPQLPIILTSGLPAESIPEHQTLNADAFLQKPYSPKVLMELYGRFTRR